MLEISDTAFIKKMLMRGGAFHSCRVLQWKMILRKKKLTLLDVKDIEITMYRQIFYHKNKFKTKRWRNLQSLLWRTTKRKYSYG